MKDNLIRFDWAMKRLLRDKSNYIVLEGFLSTLLGEDLRIVRFLESEGNQEDATDKFNRADMLVEDSKGRLLIIEVQNNQPYDYFHRVLKGVPRSRPRYTNLGKETDLISMIYSINIIFFHLGFGKDYIYHGKTEFRGLHNSEDILKLCGNQHDLFFYKNTYDIPTEYYLLRTEYFNKAPTTPLDEWFRFLKTKEIDNTATAKGLPEAHERLRVDALSPDEKRAYIRDMEALSYQRSVFKSAWIEGWAEGYKESYSQEVAKRMKAMGLPMETIIQCTRLTAEEINQL